MEFPNSLTENDREVLTGAPVLVFLLLAATAGDASRAQQLAFVAILKGAETVPSQTFAAALYAAREDYEPIRKSIAGRKIDPAEALASIKEVLVSGRITEQESEEFGHGLYYLADTVAKAGGKKRFLFGKKIPPATRDIVELVKGIFVG